MLRQVRVWRHLIAQVVVFFCGGLTGPIFLAEYFLFGEQDDSVWMLWLGVVLTVGSVVVGVVVGHFIGWGVAKLEQSQQRRALLEQRGVLALAEITGYTETGLSINDRPVVKVSLSINEQQGLPPFNTEARVTMGFTAMPLLAARRLVVLVDPATRDCQVELQASALVTGVMPVKFVVAEDNRTYDLTGQAGPVMEILRVLRANRLPFDGSFDLRSNPVVREQVLEIVRRNAAAQPAPWPGAQQFSPPAAAPNPAAGAWYPPPPPAPSAAQRLQELETLRATGAITESEYAAKRQRVIASL
jgi:hypothetical protein